MYKKIKYHTAANRGRSVWEHNNSKHFVTLFSGWPRFSNAGISRVGCGELTLLGRLRRMHFDMSPLAVVSEMLFGFTTCLKHSCWQEISCKSALRKKLRKHSSRVSVNGNGRAVSGLPMLGCIGSFLPPHCPWFVEFFRIVYHTGDIGEF